MQPNWVSEQSVSGRPIAEGSYVDSTTVLKGFQLLLELVDRPAALLNRANAVVVANGLASRHLETTGERPGAGPGWRVIGVEGAGDPALKVAVRQTEQVSCPLERRGTLWQLTPRERDVLRLLANGDANKDMANALGCSERTIEVHVSRLLAKSSSFSRAQLIVKVWNSG